MLVKTHLFVKEQYDEFTIKWVKRILDCKPTLNDNGLPTFVIISNKGRIEITTCNFCYLEEIAKKHTYPRGRGSVTTDKGFIYIKEHDNENLIGVVIHNHIREYGQMYDEL